MSIIGFLLPIVSIVLAALGFVFNFPLYALIAVVVISLLGIILSSIGCKKGKHKVLAILGIIFNVLILVAAAAFAAFIGIFISACQALFEGIGNGLSQ